MQPQFASAGNASENSTKAENPIGLYRNADGLTLGITHPVQGDAAVRQGFTLYKAAQTIKEVEAMAKSKDVAEDEDEAASKKGSK